MIEQEDDLLVCSPILEDCYRDSIKLLQQLAEGGNMASESKFQDCQPQVEYLRRVVTQGTIAGVP